MGFLCHFGTFVLVAERAPAENKNGPPSHRVDSTPTRCSKQQSSSAIESLTGYHAQRPSRERVSSNAVTGKVTACSWPDVTFSDLHTFIAPEGLCQCIFLVAGVWSANRKLGLSSGEWARQRYSREMIPIGTHSSRPVQRRPAQADPGFRDDPTAVFK